MSNPHIRWLESLSTKSLQNYCRSHPDDEHAKDELDERDFDRYHDEDIPEDTPSLQNCDDAGTGEGRWHGRM